MLKRQTSRHCKHVVAVVIVAVVVAAASATATIVVRLVAVVLAALLVHGKLEKMGVQFIIGDEA